MRSLLLVLLVTPAVALAGCGGDDEPTTSPAAAPPAASATTEPDPATTEPDPAEAPATSGAVEIGMKGLVFEPKDVTVKTGTTVTWKNLEEIPHNVVAEEGADFESDTFGLDGTFAFEAEKPATIKYVCTLHPGMEGTLTVAG